MAKRKVNRSSTSGKSKAERDALKDLSLVNGSYRKKCKGKYYFFGSDPTEAIARYRREWPFIITGQPIPAVDPDSLDLETACNVHLTDFADLVEHGHGEPSEASLSAHIRICQSICDCLGKTTPVSALNPDAFARLKKYLGKDVALKTLEGRIAVAQAVFNALFKNGSINTHPTRMWGDKFTKPSTRALTLAPKRKKTFKLAEVRKLINGTSGQLRAMILLGLNAGFGNDDCGRLLIQNCLAEDGFLDSIRHKTAKARRCPLWIETEAALAEVIGTRKSGYVFLTHAGNDWIPKEKTSKTGTRYHDDPLAKEFGKAAKSLGITGGFYNLRHMFRTIAAQVNDEPAADQIMGHSPGTMAAGYSHGLIADDRLEAITEHVHDWIWPEK